MSLPKPKMPVRRVWRITAGNPMGEWVYKVAPASAKPSMELPEVSYDSWVTSSYDLLSGADISEELDTLPGELFDDLFAPQPGAAKIPGK
jgi:hypothetical protein